MDAKFRKDKRIKKVILPPSTVAECIHNNPIEHKIIKRQKKKQLPRFVPNQKEKNTIKEVTLQECLIGETVYKSNLINDLAKEKRLIKMNEKQYPTKLNEMPEYTKTKDFTFGVTSQTNGESVSNMFLNENVEENLNTKKKRTNEIVQIPKRVMPKKLLNNGDILKINYIKETPENVLKFQRSYRKPLGKSKPIDKEVLETMKQLKLNNGTNENNNESEVNEVILKYNEKNCLPDDDLGKTAKHYVAPNDPDRCYGIPSVRTDLIEPVQKSIGNNVSFGNDHSIESIISGSSMATGLEKKISLNEMKKVLQEAGSFDQTIFNETIEKLKIEGEGPYSIKEFVDKQFM